MKTPVISIVRINNPSCFFCGGKGRYQQIVDHDEYGAIWEEEKCDCGHQQVYVDGNPLEHLLFALGYKG